MELAVISGKGGTGKSSISAAFATLSERVMVVDCDVDAANLYLLFHPTIHMEEIYVAGESAIIDESKCTDCGLCMTYCRFDAISEVNGKIIINETTCDGCHLCSRICPEQAITMVENNKSRMYSGDFRNGKMVYGKLAPGEENSGKLVAMVRDEARKTAKENNLDTIVIDGPPGIGCAVISSITGVDNVLIITEPSLSGIHDLKRTVEMTSKFNIKTWVLINKYDLNETATKQIEDLCVHLNINLAGKLPFDKKFVSAMINCQSIVEYAPESDVSKKIAQVFEKINQKPAER
ncbi:MAG: P-loop NTPase [Salinivirgaceae bacterium]|nr:P-loop NTPase [Salinivirgaceae bacterium]